MSVLGSIPIIGGIITTILGKFGVDKGKVLSDQAAQNLEEIRSAPVSRLRLWRSFLGWVLALIFVWEAVIRTTILTYWPETPLPPSMLGEIIPLLMGMLGLGL